MVVKRRPPPGPIIDSIRSWWHCQRTWQRICGQLKRAGVAEFDPVYPLVREIGMVPARISRLVIVGLLGQSAILILLAFIVFHPSASRDVETLRGDDGSTVLMISVPNGSKFVSCIPGRVCIKLP